MICKETQLLIRNEVLRETQSLVIDSLDVIHLLVALGYQQNSTHENGLDTGSIDNCRVTVTGIRVVDIVRKVDSFP